jgi:hypothetical protein
LLTFVDKSDEKNFAREELALVKFFDFVIFPIGLAESPKAIVGVSYDCWI